MKKIVALLALLLCAAATGNASAQYAIAAKAVSVCGTPPGTLTAGQTYTAFMDLTGTLCTAGGGGGGGGTVTQGTAAAAAGAWPFYLVQGTTANSSSNPIFVQGTAGSAILGKVGLDQTTPGTTNGVQTLTGSVTTATLGAGAQIVGKVGIDQTTPGTTNGVQVNAALPAGTNVIGHVINDANASVIIGKTGIDQTTVGTTNGVVTNPTSVSTSALAPVVSAAVEGTHVLKGSAGNLYGLVVTNTTVAGYVMVFNATTAPADGAVTPIYCLPIGINQTVSLTGPSTIPISFSTGISVAFSTTGCFTKTVSATAMFTGLVD